MPIYSIMFSKIAFFIFQMTLKLSFLSSGRRLLLIHKVAPLFIGTLLHVSIIASFFSFFKTDRHDITEILLKVTFIAIPSQMFCSLHIFSWLLTVVTSLLLQFKLWVFLTLNTQGGTTFYWDFVAREYNCFFFFFFFLENSSNKTHFINGNIKQEFFVCLFFL
jgi:hypothetical protein